jgi:hypothetical protein
MNNSHLDISSDNSHLDITTDNSHLKNTNDNSHLDISTDNEQLEYISIGEKKSLVVSMKLIHWFNDCRNYIIKKISDSEIHIEKYRKLEINKKAITLTVSNVHRSFTSKKFDEYVSGMYVVDHELSDIDCLILFIK